MDVNSQNQEEGDEEEFVKEKIDEDYLRKKYFNEYYQAINKKYVEIPANLVICIDLKNMEWTGM